MTSGKASRRTTRTSLAELAAVVGKPARPRTACASWRFAALSSTINTRSRNGGVDISFDPPLIEPSHCVVEPGQDVDLREGILLEHRADVPVERELVVFGKVFCRNDQDGNVARPLVRLKGGYDVESTHLGHHQ